MNVATTAASFIENDIESYKELSFAEKYVKESHDEIYYKVMNETFREIKKNTGVAFIFTEKKISDNKIAYILDGEDPNSKFFSPIGSIGIMTDIELRAFNEEVAASSDLVDGRAGGYFVKGFAPIIDKKMKEVIGIVGVDLKMDYVKNIIHGVKAMIFAFIFIIVLLVTVVVNRLLNMRAKSLSTDYLTGLYSKSYYENHLDIAIKEAELKGKTFSVSMIDIDDFKEINDQYGHIAGDRVLKSVAEIMQLNMRSVDICSRYGGDEFIVILSETKSEHAVLICERILDRISSLDLRYDGSIINVSLSIGIAEWENGMDRDDLIECADQAMYVSKSTGKNKVTVYKENY